MIGFPANFKKDFEINHRHWWKWWE